MNEEADNQVLEDVAAPSVVPAAPGPAPRAADLAIPAQSAPGACDAPGSACGAPAALSFVYAMGRIEPRFQNMAAEKEFVQAAGRTDTAGKTDQQMFQAVLSNRENRYLARQLCWVFTVHGFETYLLMPRDPADVDRLIESIRPAPGGNDIDIVIGVRGPLAPPDMCNGLVVPIVAFDQIYSFDRAALIKSIPRPDKTSAAQFGPVADQVLDQILQLTDNAGNTDEHRALNYLAVRYPAIYANAADAFSRDFSLTGVEVRPSTLSGTRRIVEVIFSQTNRKTDFTERQFVRVDVTEEFPFLVTKLSPYYQH